MSERFLPLPAGRAEQLLNDAKPLYTEPQARAEANRCLYCFDAPCIQACPTAIDIPRFIKQIASDDMRGAAKTILDSNILGHSCSMVCPVEVLCVGRCVYNQMNVPPIQIGRLQRYATEWLLDNNVRLYEAGQPNGKRVAIVGGGPAGLACAAELARRGFHAVIYESRSLPGGLNVTGVAPYKMHAPEALREVNYILDLGIELHTGTVIGRDITLDWLQTHYDAIFVGVGLGADGQLHIPGEHLQGVVGAVELIEKMKLDPSFTLDGVSNAVVIGGGNTAIDVVRELLELGVANVSLIYRRDENSMSAYVHEWNAAKKLGAIAHFGTKPIEITGDQYATGVRCVKLQAASGDWRGKIEEIPGSEYSVATDLVVVAVGQAKLGDMFESVHGLEFDNGCFVVHPETGRCGQTKWFAGGDCANGGKEVVNAAAEGKRAAAGIAALLFPMNTLP